MNRVRALRVDRLMTQRELSRRSGVALRTIHNIEKGEECRMDTKRRILRALGVPFEERERVWPREEHFA